ncbi:hypothetical protein I4U23_004113 [Adineta vaga]|nr:hypothetical protein I4U23_004113 [Adineta vaga]
MLTDTGIILPNFTELRVYPSFTEIRQQYNAPKNFKMYFTRDVYSNIVRGSLSIEGIPIESKQLVSKANNLENQIVFLRRSVNEQPQECRVIQGDDLLLQDNQTKRYIHAQRNELEYVTTPEQEGTEIIYVLKQQGKATLSYQMHGISWSTQYELNILTDDCQHTIQAFAEIINGTKQEYNIDRVELLANDVILQRESGLKRRCFRLRSRSRSRSRSDSSDEYDEDFDELDLTPSVTVQKELADFHLYSINQPFVLLSKSTFSLPFLNPTIQISKFVGLSLPFTTYSQIQKLERKYRIESIDKFLPAGPITIREQGRLVGVISLPDMTVGDKHTLSSGQDSDVSLNRQVKLISKERHSAVYTVHLTFKNVKSIPVKFEYEEIIDNENIHFKIIVKGSDEQRTDMQVTANGIQIENKNSLLAANGGQQIYEYEVHTKNIKKRNNTMHKRKRKD